MNTFRRSSPAKTVMFVVNYDEARRAYLWVDNPTRAGDDRAVGLIARTQQEQGILPEGSGRAGRVDAGANRPRSAPDAPARATC